MTTTHETSESPLDLRLILAILLPFIACGVQWLLWDAYIKPYVWFLFFPTAFFSAWIGGLRGGLTSTMISALLVWFVFIPPQFSFVLENHASAFSIVMFVVMGSLFAWLFERLRQTIHRADDVLTQMRRLNVDLEQRTAELSAANAELEGFAYAVAHDLRAPLRALSGFSQALEEDYGDRLEGDAKTWLEQIGIASRKMGELIEGILTLSRVTRGELRRDSINLSLLTTQLLEELARMEPARKVRWQVDAGINAVGDARMVEDVLRNLLGNAWKYTAKTPEPLIQVYREVKEGASYFCVADNGAGFDMAHAERLFKPFQRLHRQNEFPGIGIGLATVQRIVHRHGGNMVAEGRVGGGAKFCFTLPKGDDNKESTT